MLNWIAHHPEWLVIPFLTGILIASGVILRLWSKNKPIPAGWSILPAALTLLARLPATLYNEVTNVDEAQTLAHALTLIRSPIPWESLDFTTNGPLNAYVFFLPYWLGFKPDFLVSHLILLVLHAVIAGALYVTLRNWFGRNNAAAAMIPVWLFLAFVQAFDFIHQSSEIWSCMCLGVAVAIFSGLTAREERRRHLRQWFLAGLFLGLVPFGKPQGTPPALMAALCMLIYLLSGYGPARRKPLLLFLSGGLFAPAMLFISVLSLGVWDDFWKLYIHANLHYAAIHGDSGLLPRFIVTWGNTDGISAFFLSAAALSGLHLIVNKGPRPAQDPPAKWIPLMILLITYMGAYAVERAGRHFSHYMLVFLIPGVFLLYGWVVSLWSQTPRKGLAVGTAFLVLAGTVFLNNIKHYRYFSHGVLTERSWELKQSPTAVYTGRFLEKNDYLTVYGWSTEYYVQTQAPSATRTVTIYQHTCIWPELYEPYYRKDLEKNRPAVIIDALDTPRPYLASSINRGAQDPFRYGWLADFLNHHYVLSAVIDQNRIYVRKDRIKAAE